MLVFQMALCLAEPTSVCGQCFALFILCIVLGSQFISQLLTKVRVVLVISNYTFLKVVGDCSAKTIRTNMQQRRCLANALVRVPRTTNH